MPKIIGKSTRVVEFGGLSIDELVGNVASQQDQLSVAHVMVAEPTSEPWLTLDYDEWICVLQGTVELKYDNGEETLTVQAGQTAFVAQGERFQPVFPVADTIYVPICIPAFKPERCHREEEGVSDVSAKLKQLHTAPPPAALSCSAADASADHIDILYHMCQKTLWETAIANKTAYFPPTFAQDGHFTHATAVAQRLLQTANHFYTQTPGDWICVALSNAALTKLGIVTRFEEPKAVGNQDTDQDWQEWRCPHIFGGIPAYVDGVVVQVYPMTRNSEDGTFLAIEGIE